MRSCAQGISPPLNSFTIRGRVLSMLWREWVIWCCFIVLSMLENPMNTLMVVPCSGMSMSPPINRSLID